MGTAWRSACVVGVVATLAMLVQGQSQKDKEAKEYGYKMAVIAGDYANEDRNTKLFTTYLLNSSDACNIPPHDACRHDAAIMETTQGRVGWTWMKTYVQAITSMYKLASRANINPKKKWKCSEMWAGYVALREKGYSPEASVNGLVLAAKTGTAFSRIK